ncbi:MAG: hypothetical protein J0L69_16630 [Bacteroidetes bacterium]|nr:hypothetical protein [Bacteroidota bacterium]
MKKILLTLAAFSALTFTAAAQNDAKKAAQENMTPEQRADKETKNATEKLGLSTDQAAKFKVYSLERARSNKALREQAKTTSKEERPKLKEQRKANNDKFFANVNSILNAEQQVKWAEHKKKMQEKQAKNEAHD